MNLIFLKQGITLLMVSLLFTFRGSGQNFIKDKVDLSGYVSVIGSSVYDNYSQERYNEGLLHNRLNLYIYPLDNLTFSAQVRNRFFYTDMFGNPLYNQQQQLNTDNGWLDLTQNVFDTDKTALNINIDRLYVKYTRNKLDVTIGRQRINWGQTFAWNPNDIFNTYNYFELDYPERQGSDAIRIQYYPGMTSRLELAMNVDHENKKTLAALYHTQISNTDVQLISGIYKDDDFVIGGAFVGNIASISVSSEASYFFTNKDEDNIGYVCISGNYTFANSLFLMAEGLITLTDDTKNLYSFLEIANETSSIKNLSFSNYSVLAQLTYPVNMVFSAGLSGMLFFEMDGFYIGPTIDISLTNNLALSLAYQYIQMNLENMKDLTYNYAFLRLKYNF